MPQAPIQEVAPAPNLAALHERGHVSVFGKTGSGKSKFLQKNFRDTHLLAFYVNPHREPLQAKSVSSPQELQKLIAAGETRFQWCPPRGGSRKAVQEAFMGYVEVLFRVGKALMRGDKAEPWLFCVVDEVHLFTEKVGTLGPVETLLSEGRKYGVRVWLADQRPARVSLEVLGQAWVSVFFSLNPPDVKYLANQGYPVEEWLTWTEQPFHFVMLSGTKWTPCLPVAV